MACIISAGVTKACTHSFGGCKQIYIGNYDSITGTTYNASGVITGATKTTGAAMYEYEFVKDTAQALEELVKNGASSQINQTVNLQLNGINQAKKLILESLSLAKTFVIVKKADNVYYWFGEKDYSNGLEATVLSIDTGTAQADPSFAQITLVGASLKYASEVSASVVTSLLS